MLQGYIKKIVFSTFICALVLCANFPGLLMAAPSKQLFIEGQDYAKLPETIRSNPDVEQLLMTDPNKVQVLFFFSYGCHGCEMFHTPFEKWAAQHRKDKKNKIAIYVYPVSFNLQWQQLAKLYYVRETLDPSGKLHAAIFTAIHKNGLKLWQEPTMQKFFVQHGYTPAQFTQAFNSFNVNRMLKRAEDLTKAYGIVVTPDIVINGAVNSYRVDLSKVGNNIDRLLKVMDYLVARESMLLAQ